MVYHLTLNFSMTYKGKVMPGDNKTTEIAGSFDVQGNKMKIRITGKDYSILLNNREPQQASKSKSVISTCVHTPHPLNKQSPVPWHVSACVFVLPNLYPLGTPCMINHVQRGRLWVNESHVIGFQVLMGIYTACLKKDGKLRLAEETTGTGLVSKVYTVNKANIINTNGERNVCVWCGEGNNIDTCNPVTFP